MSLYSLLVPPPSSFLNLSLHGSAFLAKRGLFWVNMAETASVSRSSGVCWITASSLCSLDFYQENKVHKRRSLVFQRGPKNAAYLRSHTPQLRQWNSKNLPLTSSLRKTSWLSDLQVLHYFAHRVLCIDPGCQHMEEAPSLVPDSIHTLFRDATAHSVTDIIVFWSLEHNSTSMYLCNKTV